MADDGQLDIIGVRELGAIPPDWPMLFEDPLDRDGDGIAGRVGLVSGGGRPLLGKWGSRLAAASFSDFARIAGAAHDIAIDDPGLLGEIEAAFVALSPAPVSPFSNEAERRAFEARDCSACHVTDSYSVDGRLVTPLSDFLLHDMGEGPRRTTPLWTCAGCDVNLADPHPGR